MPHIRVPAALDCYRLRDIGIVVELARRSMPAGDRRLYLKVESGGAKADRHCSPMSDRHALFQAAERLHAQLVDRHVAGGLLRGPDPGVRMNLRVWRFVKSAVP